MAGVAGVTRMRRRVSFTESRLFAYALTLPTFIVAVGIVLIPLVTVLYLSFSNAQYVTSATFVGFANYASLLFTDPYFWHTLLDTIIWAVGIVAVSFAIGLGVALLLNRRIRGRGVFRALILLPWVVPSVTAALIWITLYSDGGLFDSIAKAIGLGSPAWLSDPNLALGSLMAVAIWKTTPFMIVALLAGLQSIPDELHEAAAMDGAGPFRRFGSITFPMLWPISSLMIVLSLIWRSGDFDIINIMTGGGPANATQVMTTYAFQSTTTGLDAGRGAAIAVLGVLLLVALIPYFVRRAVRDAL
jgi:ABC-type sugar transport system permease subunit